MKGVWRTSKLCFDALLLPSGRTVIITNHLHPMNSALFMGTNISSSIFFFALSE